MELTYYCCACDQIGTDFAGGRLFCRDHFDSLRHCDCPEPGYLLWGESCPKCGKERPKRSFAPPADWRKEGGI